MKTSHYFRSLFSALILLVFTQTIFAQNYNPLYVADLELTQEQRIQLTEIGNDYTAKIQKLRNTPKDGEKSKDHYQNIKKEIKLLKIERENAQKAILTPSQLSQYEGYIVEQNADKKGNALFYQKERFEDKYLGVFLTDQQNLEIYDEYKLRDLDNVKWSERQDKLKEIYKDVLTEKQYALVVQIEKEKKDAREAKSLEEIKKALAVAEELMPLVEDFTLSKMLVLRKKLEAKISDEDKQALDDLREARKLSFEETLNEGLDEIEAEFENVENPELIRYLGFTKDLVVDNSDLISNAWSFGWDDFFGKGENSKRLIALIEKYQNEIDALENELLYVIKETAKKGAVIASSEYPVPPVALWIDEIKLDEEIKKLFLLLDPTDDFSFDIESFDVGEGQHVASAFPNPANKNQMLEFNTQQDGKVTIEIIDESGKVVKVISSENRMKGNQKLAVNVQDLNSQIYFYRISSDEGVTLIKFSVVK